MRKPTLFLLVIFALAMLHNTSAQSLLKDLRPGPHPASSNPDQYINVNGTMFFLTRASTGSSIGIYQLWKSNGTAAGTVMLKDSLDVSVSGSVEMCTNVGSTLFFMVSPYSSTSTYSPQLWKSDGTVAGTTMVTTLTYTIGTGACAPGGFVAMGGKLYFHFGQNHGRELWVSDGTAAGTMEILDLAPGSSSGQQNWGVEDKDMVVYHGKIYFSGTTTLGNYELYCSDGTAAGTVLHSEIAPGVSSSNPNAWIIYHDELYFTASNAGDNLWKTDGTTVTQMTTSLNVYQPVIFKDELYFGGGIDLWKTDGTVAGTSFITDSVMNVAFTGANSDYLFSIYQKYISTPPYYIDYYFRSDGTAAGTVPASYDLVNSASFNLIDNIMYTVRLDSGSFTNVGLWATDGTEAGTTKLFNGYGTGYAFIYQDTVFFSNYDAANGYELWYYNPSAPTAITAPVTPEQPADVYPNPSTGIFNIRSKGNTVSFEVYNALGRQIRSKQTGSTVDLSGEPTGIYLLTIFENNSARTQKIILR